MSEEKLYAVMDDEGLLLLYSEQGAPLWRVWGEMFADKSAAERAANAENGHVVTFVEEPKKVVLSEKQAKIVEKARDATYPAAYISMNAHPDPGANGTSYEELRLMRALVNGYTVAKEKKYNIKVPHVPLYYWKKPNGGLGVDDLNVVTSDDDTDAFEFTEAEIEQYSLQDCKKEEVTDDAD